jgi:endonuclease/exonuclease/phosphatase family metal-dependent hydrolase
MTFNVRRRMNGLTWPPADRWSIRQPRVHALLREERPTILGAQEALPDQAAAVRDALGESHRTIGHGRHPGPRGEACAVFYDDERLELREWRQLALSDRPDEAGSTSWGNVIPRVYVRASFRDRSTSQEFVVINTHLDAFSPRARRRAAEELRRVAAAETRPLVMLGDLNAGPTSPPWRSLVADGGLTDAWISAESQLSPEWRTFAGYRQPCLGRRIDAILVSRSVRVRRAAINAHSFAGGWPSDHLPVQALLTISRSTEER